MATGKRDISRHYRVKRRTVELPEKECKHRGVCECTLWHCDILRTNPIVVATSNINNWPCPSPGFRPSLGSPDIFMDRGRSESLSFPWASWILMHKFRVSILFTCAPSEPRSQILWECPRTWKKQISPRDFNYFVNFILRIIVKLRVQLRYNIMK